MSDFIYRDDARMSDVAQETEAPRECCGCPSTPACHDYCVSIGAAGGYCEGFLDLRCRCYY